MDNDLYTAMREGRVPIRLEVDQAEDGQWIASYDQFGVKVSVKDDSMSYAQNQATQQVFEKVRNGEFEVKVA